MTDNQLMQEIDNAIARAAEHDIELKRSEFRIIEGEPTLDGMPALEWIDDMTMD